MIARTFTALSAVLMICAGAFAQESRAALNHPTVVTILNTCVGWAEARQVNLSIAVVDTAGQLRGFVTMDDALLATRDFAQRKAYTSVAGNAPSGDVAWIGQLPGVLDSGAYMPLQGGVPVRTADGTLIGAVGVSGAPPEIDERCAMAAIDAAGLQHGIDQSEGE